MLLVMIESLADFGNPLLLGGGTPFLATEVFLAIEGRFDPHEAAVYGVVLLALALALFLVQRRWLAGVSVVTVTGRPRAGGPSPLPRVADWSLTGLFLALRDADARSSTARSSSGGFVRVWGIDHRADDDALPGHGGRGLPVLLDTARLAAIAAVPAALLGFLIAYLTTRHRFVGRGALEFCALLSYALPGTVMGVGYILAFNQGGLKLTGHRGDPGRGVRVPRDAGGRAQRHGRPRPDGPGPGGGVGLAPGRTSLRTLRRVVLPLVLPGAPDRIHLLLRARR